MKKVLMALFIISLFLPMTVHAAPPEYVEGTFSYVPLGDCVERFANDNLFWRDCTDEGEYYEGAFIGESDEVYDVVLHGFQGSDSAGLPLYDQGWYKGRVTFKGYVNDIGGGEDDTMVIMFVGKSPGGPGGIFNWSGTWRIIGGTGALANVHGQGVWWNTDTPFHVHYEGKVHFSP